MSARTSPSVAGVGLSRANSRQAATHAPLVLPWALASATRFVSSKRLHETLPGAYDL